MFIKNLFWENVCAIIVYTIHLARPFWGGGGGEEEGGR